MNFREVITPVGRWIWGLRRALPAFVLVLLAIEFVDEIVFGAREAAWPLIRDDLGLNYAQIGILLSVPAIVASLVEPVLGILADVWKRRLLILGGGVLFAAALLLTAGSTSFVLLLISFILFYPSSGAFVSLSQAALMDHQPERTEQNMARWTFAGSLGVVAGPLVLGLVESTGAGWRGVFLGFGLVAMLLTALVRLFPARKLAAPAVMNGDAAMQGVRSGFRGVMTALRSPQVIRWLTLLTFSDLMLDVLLGYLTLYFVDVVAVTPAQAGIAFVVWSGLGLLGDFLLIPLLERVPGLVYLRISVVLELVLYPCFLLVPGYFPKLALLGLLGFFNAGWYAILKAGLYQALPGKSGTVLAVDNLFGLLGSFIPMALGWLAQEYNLSAAMWCLVAGPLVFFIWLPRQQASAGRNQRDTE